MDAPLHTYDAYDASPSHKRTQVKAPSLYAAKLAAQAFFKTPKSRAHNVSVVLVQKADGTDVSLFNSNADFG